MNFFASGRDATLASLKQNPYCPLVLLTGTVSDYRNPTLKNRHESITEISFSSLHTGGEDTGYIRTPDYQPLSTIAALSGAGCLDAISLSMAESIKHRFWLEMLNLCWGGYILFTKRGAIVAKCWARFVTVYFGRTFTWFLYRFPSCLLWFIMVVTIEMGLRKARHTEDGECSEAKHTTLLGIFMFIGMMGLSFFAFLPPLEFLMFNPILRQIHQATRFIFESVQPPGMLYVTDGGVRDCTAILQLMRRRCEHILLVLAAADPKDELGVLRTAMEAAIKDKIGSFYDPSDSHRDIRILLEEYKNDKTKSFFKLGIRYGWGGDDSQGHPHGTLYVVKNRLPTSLESQLVEPLITEEEVRGESVQKDLDSWAGMKTVELGGFGCCDCCHASGCNCGVKFPHLTGANYMYLTPTLFSSLSRLGFEVSRELIEGEFSEGTTREN